MLHSCSLPATRLLLSHTSPTSQCSVTSCSPNQTRSKVNTTSRQVPSRFTPPPGLMFQPLRGPLQLAISTSFNHGISGPQGLQPSQHSQHHPTTTNIHQTTQPAPTTVSGTLPLCPNGPNSRPFQIHLFHPLLLLQSFYFFF